MSDFTRNQKRATCQGVNVRLPQDQLPAGKFGVLENVRAYQLGSIQTRPGLTAVNSTPLSELPVHSLIRLNDTTPTASQPYTRIVGAGTKLFAGVIPASAAVDTGYSGDPLSMAVYRPDQALSPWVYIANPSRMSKIDVGGNRENWGIAPPLGPPSATINMPSFQIIDNFNVTTGWTNFGGAAAPSTTARIPNASPITAILYDNGSTGGCLIVPTTFSFAMQPGLLLTLSGSAEVVLVQYVRWPLPPTTVSSIQYDSGTSGPCSIVATNLMPDAGITEIADMIDIVLYLNSSEYVRVTDAIQGPDGTYSIRCATVGTIAAGDTIVGVQAMRTATTLTHTTAETMSAIALETVITAPSTAPFIAGVHKTVSVNMLNLDGRPAQPDDEIHISVQIQGLTNLTEGRVVFDVDATTNDFSHNYFFVAFRPPDISAAMQENFNATNPPATLQQAVQVLVSRDQYAQGLSAVPVATTDTGDVGPTHDADPGAANPGSASFIANMIGNAQQTGFGDSQWLELRFKYSDLQQVGTDTTRTMSQVAAIQIQLSLTGSATLLVDSLWIGGSYGPDIGSQGQPYLYRFRGRNSSTGERSNPSPPMRSGVIPRRQTVTVACVQHPDSQVDWLDVERYGGNLTDWYLVGSTPNGATPTFEDAYDDAIIAENPIGAFDSYQPVVSVDAPRAGVCNTIGTTVTWVSGDPFNPSWAPGSVIEIDGVPYTLYAQPSGATQLEINENAGTQTTVSFLLQEATLLAQPVRAVFGDFDGYEFLVGDVNQPGTVFWTTRFQPGSMPDTASLDVTDPSNPLQNGVMYAGFPWVFAQTLVGRLAPDYSNPGQFLFQIVLPNHGLFAPYAFASGPVMCFLDVDGIYEFDGTTLTSITNADLYPLFPHDGQPGVVSNGFYPPDLSQPDALRIAYAYGQWFFDYQDTNGSKRTLVYDRGQQAWYPDTYAAQVQSHYGESAEDVADLLAGGSDGRVYVVTGPLDGATPIASIVQFPAEDGGDLRLDKTFGDAVLDVNASTVPVTTMLASNTYQTALTPVAQPLTTGRALVVLDIDAGEDDLLATNLGLRVTWTGSGPIVYGWGWALIPKIELTSRRATDWDNAGQDAFKFVQGVLIRADTLGQSKQVQVQYDGSGTATPTLTVNDTGERTMPYALNPPIQAHLVRLQPLDAVPWRLYTVEWVFEPAPEAVLNWQTQGTDLDADGFKHVYLVAIAHASTSDLTFTVTIDGVPQTYLVANSGAQYVKTYVTVLAIKGKLFSFGLTASQPFQVFARDCEVWVMPWASSTPYQVAHPFGGPHRAVGAQI